MNSETSPSDDSVPTCVWDEPYDKVPFCSGRDCPYFTECKTYGFRLPAPG